MAALLCPNCNQAMEKYDEGIYYIIWLCYSCDISIEEQKEER